MNEGWLFRLRTNLGAGRSAPAWPQGPTAPRADDGPCLRRPAAAPPASAEEAHDVTPEPPSD